SGVATKYETCEHLQSLAFDAIAIDAHETCRVLQRDARNGVAESVMECRYLHRAIRNGPPRTIDDESCLEAQQRFRPKFRIWTKAVKCSGIELAQRRKARPFTRTCVQPPVVADVVRHANAPSTGTNRFLTRRASACQWSCRVIVDNACVECGAHTKWRFDFRRNARETLLVCHQWFWRQRFVIAN